MRALLSSLLLAACGGGVSTNPGVDGATGDAPATVGSFDEEVEAIGDAVCDLEVACVMEKTYDACIEDVRNDMADAKAALDAAGEQRCAECMHVKAREIRKIVDSACDVRAADEAAVLAACDLNPSADFDGDGTPDNDDDEACAGFP